MQYWIVYPKIKIRLGFLYFIWQLYSNWKFTEHPEQDK